ncbi:MAG: hypothetical protein Unbinned5336contig1001_35 [Prokaryotic dsDNA virus sp.]|nr:MAG: hypothetical protein Unbinned5336contig1001_35 [Prokaryotic dsDNA virus sp.]|tara:strand:- start:18567 stop:19334 length:768 start_codon:yes stop_codon:yes gene_type:complete
MQIKNDYVIIPGSILRDENLSMMQRMLYAKLLGLDNDKGCYASNQYLADCLGVSKHTVSRAISDLEKKGYISTEIVYKKNSKEVDYRGISCISHTPLINMREGTPQMVKDNIKKEYKVEKETFDLFWIHYPKKVGKAKAWVSWKANYKDIDSNREQIMNHIKKAYTNTEKQFIPNPATYINQERWWDEIIEHKEEIDISLYKRDTTDFPMGYCQACGDHSSYTVADVRSGGSRCCDAKILPTKEIKNGSYRKQAV